MIKNILADHMSGDVNTKTDLCKCYQRMGSDKSTYHNYSALYYRIFQEFQYKNINFLEVGLGTNNLDVKSNMGTDGRPGASLYTISEQYKHWNIYGLDVDKRILFQDQARRISTYFVDQTDASTIRSVCANELKDLEFHIMIDDGLHEFAANRNFFQNSFHMLAPGGYYIIEDILYPDTFQRYFDLLGMEYHLITIPHPYNDKDNTLLIIQKNS